MTFYVRYDDENDLFVIRNEQSQIVKKTKSPYEILQFEIENPGVEVVTMKGYERDFKW